MEIIDIFHLEWGLILAQLVNFSIVALVLWFFALKPLIKKMQERTAKIEQGLKQAEEAGQKFQQAGIEREKNLLEAKKEAQAILQQAKESSENERQLLAVQAHQEAQKIVATAKDQLIQEKAKVLREIKEESAELIVQVAEKILKEKLDPAKDAKFIKKAIEDSRVK